MKKLALLATLVAAVAGSIAVSNAFAFDQQATGFACRVFDENGGTFITHDSSDTLYSSGKEQLHCWGQSPSGGNGTFVEYHGFPCGLHYLFGVFLINPNNKDTVSKTGASALTCYNGDYSVPASSGSIGAAE
jgi:hypothetical protein